MLHPIRRSVAYVLSLTTLSLFLPFTSTHAAPVLTPGALVKSPSSSAVYEIAEENGVQYRLVFPMQSVYESWYGVDFSKVTTLSQEDLNTYPIRKPKSFKPGSVVKSPSLPKVYRVNSPLSLEWIENESDFLKLGYTFSQVKDIPDGFFTSYKILGSAAIPGAPVPPPPPVTAPTTSTPPEPTEPEKPFEISSRSFTPETKESGSIFVKTTNQSDVTLTYSPVFSSTESKKMVSSKLSTEHIFNLVGLLPKTKYSYILTAKNPTTGITIEESGSFISYYDLLISAHGSAPAKGSIRQEKVEVGTFVLYNNSKMVRSVNELWFQFSASNSVTDKVTRTIDIVDITPGSALYGSVVSFKTIASGTTIRNSLALQKFQLLDLEVQPGSQRVFSVRIVNLDSINPEEFDGSSFVTSIENVVPTGDSEVYIYSKTIGTRYHVL